MYTGLEHDACIRHRQAYGRPRSFTTAITEHVKDNRPYPDVQVHDVPGGIRSRGAPAGPGQRD